MDELSKIKRSIQNMASKNRASLYTAKVTAVHGDVCDVDKFITFTKCSKKSLSLLKSSYVCGEKLRKECNLLEMSVG